MTSQAINNKYLALLNSQVAKAQVQRDSGNYNEHEHEAALNSIIGWRNRNLHDIGVFNSFASTTRVPARVSATKNAAYQAQVKQINNDYNLKVKQLQQGYNALVKEADAKIKLAQKYKDIGSLNTLRGAKSSAATAYKQSLAQAKIDHQNAIAALSATVAAGNPVPTPVDNSVPPPYSPGPAASGGSTYYTTNYGGGGGGSSSDSGGQSVDQGVAAGGAQQDFGNSWDFSWLFDLLLGPAPVGQTAGTAPNSQQQNQVPPQAPQFVVAEQQEQLDIFDDSAWAHGGADVFGSAITGNNTIKRVNSLPVIPARAVGFGQWGAIVSSVIQAGASIGAAALQPKPVQPKPVVTNSGIDSNTLLMVGGGVAVLGLVAILATRGGKRK